MVLVPQISDRVIRMVEDRAKGGCASVVNGEIPVNFDDSLRPIIVGPGKLLQITVDYKNFHDPAFATFQKNAEAIRKHGSIALAELSHFGIEKPFLDDGILPLGPVAYKKEDGTQVKAFDKESMEKITNDFADAADYMKAAGFQGVFIHGGHGWMIGQFLSNRNNKRRDEYGGSIENRARFPLAILKAVRERCGSDFLIEIRLSGEEKLPGGITIDETVGFCKLLEGRGLVDLIHISSGHYYSPARTHEFSSIFAPHALNAEYAAAVKKAVTIPVAVVGGITTALSAEEIIAEGKADIVSMGRQMIADPAFANKAIEGRSEEIRECIRCCVCYPGPIGEHETDRAEHKHSGLGSCTINPYSVSSFSHHKTLPEEMPKPKASRKVLILGGGPGGMQAAIDATDRGHEVILVDDSDRLGGILRVTDNDFYKKDLRDFKNLLIREVEKRDIDVRLNTHGTPELISEINPDALILSIGAEPLVPDIPGVEKAIQVLDVYFKPGVNIGRNIVIVGGGLVGCEVGLEFVHMGKEVTIIEMLERLAASIIGIYRTALLDHMDEVGIRSMVKTKCKEIRDDGVVVEDGTGKETFLQSDTVVLAAGMKAKTGEVKKLRDAAGSIPVFEIGDCVRPAKIGEAVQEGYTAAMMIV
jgi:2,4-dienoyl-CoA reductase-like NADH-dependent reductase (Old Yellow Enzyme family)/thioredoxin reductase